MVIMNTSARVIICGPYKLIPYMPVKAEETKSALLKKYPRIGKLMDKKEIVTVKESEAAKVKAKTEEAIKKAVEEAEEAAADSDSEK